MEVLTGWGRATRSGADVVAPPDADAVGEAVADASARGIVARGLGRSYGDAATNAGGRVVATDALTGIVAFDATNGVLTAAAGTSLDDILLRVVPHGWFVPVVPGTRHVSLGGAAAADVHGKNHHDAGSFCEHITEMGLVTPADGPVRVSPHHDPELFWATAGGMGLTGIITDVTMRLGRAPTAWIASDTVRAGDLDTLLAETEAAENAHPFAVSWIDLSGRRMGRGVVASGRFAHRDELSGRHSPHQTHRPRPLLRAPTVPVNGLLNAATVGAFNEAWFRRAPRRPQRRLEHYSSFFHPLDAVADWNRLYGPRGFIQWQMVVPHRSLSALEAVIETLRRTRTPSFLAVLKRLRAANQGHLSFPAEGWTLAMDIPAAIDGLGAVLDRLDDLVVDAGGRTYLAKDSRIRSELMPRMYPRLDEWREVRDRADPHRRMQSDLGRRLDLLG